MSKNYRIKVKTPSRTTIITNTYACADLAWSHAWLIAGHHPRSHQRTGASMTEKFIQDALNFVGSCALGLLFCLFWLSADSWGAL